MNFSRILMTCLALVIGLTAHTFGVLDIFSIEGVEVAATAGLVSVKDLRIYKNVTAVWTAYGCAQSASIAMQIEMLQTTCKDSGLNEEVDPGVFGGSFQMSNLVAFDHALGIDEVMTDFLARTSIDLRLTTDESGDTYIEASGYWESVEVTSDGTSGPASYSATFKISGGVTQGAVT